MAMKVVDNVQIFLDNIHVRYEDDVSNPGAPFAFGFTLDSLHAQSCDEKWQAAFLTVGADVIHKLVTLQNLSIYLNTTASGNARFVDCESAEAMSKALRELIPSSAAAASQPDHYYLLKPVSGLLKATLDRGDLVLTRPRLTLDAELSKIGVALNSSQFQRAQDVLEHFSLYVRSLEYMDIRPPVDVTPAKDPKLWWKFVLTAVRQDVRKKYVTWTWDYMKQRSLDRTTYMELHTKKLNVTLAKMSSTDQKLLEALEKKLDYNDIITFRQLAAASWQKKQQEAADKKKAQGWFGGWFGGGGSAKAEEKDEATKNAEQEAAMKELYAAIGYNAEQVEKETVFPKEYVKTAVNFKIESCTLELRQDDIIDEKKVKELGASSSAPSSSQSQSTDLSAPQRSVSPPKSGSPAPPISRTIVSFEQKGFVVSLLMREGSMSVVSTLDTIKMSDFHTLAGRELVMLEPDFGGLPKIEETKGTIKSVVKHAIEGAVEEAESKEDLEAQGVSPDSQEVVKSVQEAVKTLQQLAQEGAPVPAFMAVTFDMNPLDAPDLDIRVALKMQPVQSTLSRALIDRIVQFFERKTTRVQLVEISSAAASTWDDLRNRAQTSLKYTIEKRTKLKLDLELAAPRFTIPQNFTDPTCPAIILDLGTITFKSDPDARSRAVAGPTTDATVSEDYFYDRFDISMKNLHAMVVGGNEAPWARAKEIDPSKYVVINKFDVDVVLKLCGAPSPDLPQLKISGGLKHLALDITDYRITWILGVLEAVGKSTIPPKVLTPEEKAAMKLLMREMKEEEARRAKLQRLTRDLSSTSSASLFAPIEPSSSTSSVDSFATAEGGDTPSIEVKRKRRKSRIVSISEAPGTPPTSESPLSAQSPNSPFSKPTSSDSPSTSSAPTSPVLQQKGDSPINAAAIEQNMLRKQLEVDFSLGELSVTLHKTVPVSAEAGVSAAAEAGKFAAAPPSTPLTTLALKVLVVKFAQTNHWMTVSLRLGAFVVEDKLLPNAPNLIESGTLISKSESTDMVEVSDLVELRYKNVPRNSFAFDNVEHDIKAKFGALKVNLNRVTIACLMQVGNDFTTSMSQNKQIEEDEAKKKEEEEEKKEEMAEEEKGEEIEVQPPRSDISMAKIDVSLGEFIVCLQKENVAFMQFNVARSQVWMDLRGDSVLHLKGYLGGISLGHTQPKGMMWPNLVSISGDKILNFEFSKYNRASPTYPGFDMSVKANMSSLKAVVVNSSLQELAIYFSAFDKMRKAVEVTTAYYYNASLDAVRTAAEAATKIQLNISINNPTIIVPQSSKDSRHIVLDLGKITLRNSWESLFNGVQLDMIEASVSGLNLRALADPNASDFVKQINVIHDSNVNAIIKRPLAGNDKFFVPTLDLNANIDSIDLNLTEDHLQLVFGILGDNLAEKPARSDSVELAQIVEFLSTFSYTMETWEQANQSLEAVNEAAAQQDAKHQQELAKQEAHLNLQVHAYLKQVSLTVHKGSGENPDTGRPTCLVTFAIQNLSADYKAYTDSRMDVDVKLGSVILEDKRVYSENKFRRIWAPNMETSQILGNKKLGKGGKRVKAIPKNAQLSSSSEQAADGGAMGNSQQGKDSPSASQSHPPQFSFSYQLDPNQYYTSMRMELFRPRLYLIPGAIQELYEFAMDQVETLVKSLENLKKSHAAASADEKKKKEIDNDDMNAEKDPKHHHSVGPISRRSSISLAASSQPKNATSAPSVLSANKAQGDEAEKEEPTSTTKIEIILTSPELCVVENTDKVDPIALILHLGESKLRLFTTSDGQMKLDLGVQKLDIYKCILDAERADLALDIVKLTQPLSLGVNLGSTANDKIKRMAVEVGVLQAIVSYNDVKLFLDIYESYKPLLESFSKPRGVSAADLAKAANEAVADLSANSLSLIEGAEDNNNAEDAVEAGAAIASELDLAKDSKELKKELKEHDKELKKAEKEAKKDDKENKKKKKKEDGQEEEEEELEEDEDTIQMDRSVQTQLMIVTVDRIILSLLNDRESPDYTTPVAEQSLESVKVMFSMYESGAMDALITLSTLELKAYNNRLAAYEPVIEPWSAEISFLKTNVAMGVHLVSQEMMDVNITKSLLDTTFGLLKLLDEFKDPAERNGGDGDSSSQSSSYASASASSNSKVPLSKQKRKKKRVSFNPYVIRNESNHPVAVRLSHAPTSVLNIPSGADMPISLQVDREQAAQRIIRPEMDVSFSGRADLSAIGRVPVSRIATHCYDISATDPDLKLVIDVSFDQGSKIITLRSNRLIHNDTDSDMDIGWIGANSSTWSTDFLRCPANSHVSLPIEATKYRSLRFRPSNTGTTGEDYAASAANSASGLESAPSPTASITSENLKWFEWGRGEEELEASREEMRRLRKKGHIPRDASRSALVLCIDEARDSTWVCRAKEVERTVEGAGTSRAYDYVMTLSPALTIENATCSDMEVHVVNPTKKSASMTHISSDEFAFPVVPPQTLARATHMECYRFDGWSMLQQHGLGRISVGAKIPGFAWSENVKFAEHAHWVPVKGNPNKLLEPLKIGIPEEIDGKMMDLKADVKVDDLGTCHITIYSEYWIINQSGLNLWYRDGNGNSSADRPAAGQRIPPPEFAAGGTPILTGDPSSWYDPLNGDLEPTTDFKYANNRFFFGGTKLAVKVEDSSWSKPFPLGIQNEGMITIKDKTVSGRRYDFGVKVKPAPGRFWRTKLVRLLPGYILVNKSQRALRYRQEGQQGRGFVLQPNQQLPFHWPVIASSSEAAAPKDDKEKAKCRLTVSTEENADTWSPTFALDIAGSFQVRLRNEFTETSEEKTLDVIIKPMEGSTFVVFGEQTKDNEGNPVTVVSYEIQNKTSHDLNIRQKDSNFTVELPALQDMPFCWDVPQILEPKLLLTLTRDPPKHTPAELSLDIIAKSNEIPAYIGSDGTRLLLEVQAQGPKKVLIVTDGSVSPSLLGSKALSAPAYKPISAASSSAQESVSLDAEDKGLMSVGSEPPKRIVSMHLKVSLKGIGVSVIDATPQELLYFTLQTLYADITISNLDQEVELKIGMAQLDNQLYLSPLPIALYSTPNPDKPFFHASIIRDPNISAVQFFKYFAVQILEIELAIHEVFLYRLLSFTKFLTDYLYAKSEEEALQKLLLQTDSDIPKLKDEDLKSSDMFYFELFHLNPIKVLVSFMTSIDLDANMEGGTAGSDEGGSNTADAGVGGLAEILGYVGILTDIERAPIELNALMMKNPFCSKNDLLERITKHYTRAGLKQAYKIVGSADFLGNPVSLVSNLGTGVKDFFYEPAMGIVESPAAFGRGLAKGTASLMLKTTYAIFDTASKLTGTVAKVGAKLTLDDDYQRERAVRNQTKARHAGEGLVYGARDFGIGIYKGITGVVLEPIKGGQQEGAVGVFKGIGKGLAGIILKPVVGAVDLVTRTTEGIKNTTTYMDEKSKAPIRPPRYFGADGLVRIFDYEKAAGQLVLRTLTERRGRRDIYESHVLLKEKLVVLSRRHIFLLNQDGINFGSKWKIEWMDRLSNIVVAIVVIPEDVKADDKSSSSSSSSSYDSFIGVVFITENQEAETARHAVRSTVKQAGALAKRLTAMSVSVKRSSRLSDTRNPPSKLISGAPIQAHAPEEKADPKKGSQKQIDSSSAPQKPHSRQQSISNDPNSHVDAKQPNTRGTELGGFTEDDDGFTIKINPKAGRYGALADWVDTETDDEEGGLYGSRSAKSKRKRKARATETSRLLGDDPESEGCCSCRCNIM